MKKSTEELTNVIIMFDPLIHHWLHHYQLSTYHNDYQDHLQEMRLKLIKLYQKFEGDPLNCLDHRYQFIAYAGRGLKWFLLNRLRQSTHQVTPTDPLILSDLMEELGEESSKDSKFLLQEAVKDHLKERERKIFNLILQGKWRNHEICQLCNISERTLRNDKKRIASKIGQLFKESAKNFILFLPVFFL